MTSIHRCMRAGEASAVVLAAWLSVGCGGSNPSKATCEGKGCTDASSGDGGGGVARDGGSSDAALDESDIWEMVLGPDGSLADSGQFGGPLEVSIDIQGQDRACGSCAVLLADIRGGTPPYEVVWSDPDLEGYGPHEVCGDESEEYTLKVTDSGPGGEFADKLSDEASLVAACEERAAGKGLSGCKVLIEGSIFNALEGPDDAQIDRQYGCEELDGSEGIPGREIYDAAHENPDAGPPRLAASGLVIPQGGFRAGESYQISLDLLFGVQVGGDVRGELWGSEVGCSKDEKLGELRLRTEDLGHASFCFTPEHDYEKMVLVTGDDTVNPLLGFSLGVSFSACDHCD